MNKDELLKLCDDTLRELRNGDTRRTYWEGVLARELRTLLTESQGSAYVAALRHAAEIVKSTKVAPTEYAERVQSVYVNAILVEAQKISEG